MLKWMFKEYADVLIRFIDAKSTNKRKYKYSTEYCLNQVCYVLQTNLSWKYLVVDCHYSTIFKRFQYWTSMRIFDLFYVYILQMYIDKQLTKDPSHFKVLYIDGSMIKNRRGVDFTGYNHYDRCRQATKINVICDQNEVPLCSIFTPANVADSCSIEDCLVELETPRLRLNNRYNHVLVGDAGYIKPDSFKTDLYIRHRTKLVHPYRCNQTSKEEKEKIKAANIEQRHKIKMEKAYAKAVKKIEDKSKSKDERAEDLRKHRENKRKIREDRTKEKVRLSKEKAKLKKLKKKNKQVADMELKSCLNTKKELEYLKDRSKIEHVFCRIDAFKKLRDRDERTLRAYVSFNYIGITIMILKFLFIK